MTANLPHALQDAFHAAQLSPAAHSCEARDFCDFCVRTRKSRNAKVTPVSQAKFVQKTLETPTQNAPQAAAQGETFAAR
jgi:hypothetical protein